MDKGLLNSQTVHEICRQSKGFRRRTNLDFLCVLNFVSGQKRQMKSCQPSSRPDCFGLCTPVVGKKHPDCPTTKRRPCPYRQPDTRSNFCIVNAQSKVIPRAVKVPEWVPLLIVEEICTSVLPDEAIAECSGRERN
jgi:hypothetical protein